MPIKYRTGDLLKSDITVIGHGCNCQGVMGAGIALAFRNRYPEMFKEYQWRCKANLFVPGSYFTWYSAEDRRSIVSLATQKRPGKCASLELIRSALTGALGMAGLTEFAIPRVGAGLGGLSWSSVKAELEDIASKTKTNLVVYTL